ncbi:hypothetical protein F5Y10DRAFT_103143 [Nemania abortiva]|nr:hypothetical protein F5Y10DRAFT_103143 [Nemania abortiva]
MTGGNPDRPRYWGEPCTAPLWRAARECDHKLGPRRQNPVMLPDNTQDSARIFRAAAGLLHLPETQSVEELNDDTEAPTGSSVTICAATDETAARLRKYLVRVECLVRFEGKPIDAEKFDPCRRITSPTVDVKQPRVLVLLLMNNDDIFTTIQTIERLHEAITQQNARFGERRLVFNLIGGVKKTGPLALLLGRFAMNLKRCLSAFRYEEFYSHGDGPVKRPPRDEYSTLPQWNNTKCLDRDMPLRADRWNDWNNMEEWDSRDDRIHKAFALVPQGQHACLLRSYYDSEPYLRSNISTFMGACEAALQWPEDKGVIRIERSISHLSTDSDGTAPSLTSDSSRSVQSLGETKSISPSSSFQDDCDTDTSSDPSAFENDIDNPIFHGFREARTLWRRRNITFISIGPTINTSDHQSLDFVSQQFLRIHKNLEESGYLRYVWVNSRDPTQDFTSHAEAICSL